MQDPYQHHDHFAVDDLLSDEHKVVRDSIRSWVKKRMSPVINDYAQRSAFPEFVVKELGEIGAFGPNIPAEYGGGGMDEIAYGIIMQELERCDSGLRSTASVQGSLVMYPIWRFGTEEQKASFLPRLATGVSVRVLRPDRARSRVQSRGYGDLFRGQGRPCRAERCEDLDLEFPSADVAVVWAKDEEGKISGFDRRARHGRLHNSRDKKQMVAARFDYGRAGFHNVKVPKENLFPDIKGLRGPLSCLSSARYGIAWGSIGAALDCYDTALRYAQERRNSVKPHRWLSAAAEKIGRDDHRDHQSTAFGVALGRPQK